MTTATPNQRSEFATRSHEYYETAIRPKLTPADEGKYVAIDVESGDFELDDDDYLAKKKLRDRHPGAQLWLEQAGFAAAYGRIGSRTRVPL